MKVIEQLLIEAGISPIAGVDEAGRGACAGPLVVAAVILKDPFHPDLAPVRDSKEIKENKREALFDLVIEHSLAYSIIEIPAAEVDSRGVHAANLDGMRRAVQALKVSPAYVLTADGGTRTAAITGGFVALKLCIDHLLRQKDIKTNPIQQYIAAISCGIVEGKILLDLNYEEDSKAEIDANFVVTENMQLVEIQATGERKTI